MSAALKGFESRETSLSSKVLQHEKNGGNNIDDFTFLVPKIPPKTLENVIPTGKQIPRTPLKPTDPVPKTPVNEGLCLMPTDLNESQVLNMIPKGREIPRTPPVYLNLPFRESGCLANPFSQVPDLGVQPLANFGDGDETDIKIKETIKEGKITIRKHRMPKLEYIDTDLEVMEDVKSSDKENISEMLPVHIKNNGNRTSDVIVKDKTIYAENCEESSKIISKGKDKDSKPITSSLNCDESLSDVPQKKKTVNSEKHTEVTSKSRGKCATRAKRTNCMVSSQNHNKSFSDVATKGDKIVIIEKPTKVTSKGRGKHSPRAEDASSSLSSPNQNENLTDVALKDKGVNKTEEPCQVTSNDRKKLDRKVKSTKSNLAIRRNPQRRAREGISYQFSP